MFFFKLAISLGLLAYLVWIIDWQRAIRTLHQADKLVLLAIPFCFLTGYVFSSSRWQIVLADSMVKLSFCQAYKGYLLGAFYSIFLPGVIAGDAVRVGLCAKEAKCEVGVATASVLLERTSGAFTLFFFVLCVCLVSPASLSPVIPLGNTPSLIVVVAAVIMAMGIVMLGLRTLSRWSSEKATKGLWKIVVQGIHSLANLRGRTLGRVLMLSALFQGTDIVAAFLLSKAIGLTVSLAVFFAVIPLVYLATVLPISLGGLGVREGTLVLLLTQFHVASSDAVTLSFLIYINRVGIAALGGLVQLLQTLRIRPTEPKVEA